MTKEADGGHASKITLSVQLRPIRASELRPETRREAPQKAQGPGNASVATGTQQMDVHKSSAHLLTPSLSQDIVKQNYENWKSVSAMSRTVHLHLRFTCVLARSEKLNKPLASPHELGERKCLTV